MVQLQAVDITPENFAPFGQVRCCLRPLPASCTFLLRRRSHANALPLVLLLVPAGICCPRLQLVGATDDGKQFDQEDAQLQLDQGQPRCEGGEGGRLRSSSMRA